MKSSHEFRVLVVRLGAMGDILHALPAVGSLRKSFPEARISWALAPRWEALLDGNPDIDELIPFRRKNLHELLVSWRRLRLLKPDVAIDFQGLIQSALAGRASRPSVLYGWAATSAREPLASRLYSRRLEPHSRHIVDRNLELAAAAGATSLVRKFQIPRGKPEGILPDKPFVLTNPFAGWRSKQWPLERYVELAERLKTDGLALVANVPPERAREISELGAVAVHTSSLSGLIDATRRATAIIGLDSGPTHLAAALRKPGVALFGPTDPGRNGPYVETMRVLRHPEALTTYKRRDEIDPSMRAITISEVHAALLEQIAAVESRA